MSEKNKELHKAFCEEHPEVPIFLRPGWLNSLVPEKDWGVIVAGNEEYVKGFLVYYVKRKFGFRKITIPPLTPYLGPWIRYPEGQKMTERIGHEKKVMDELIEQLPSVDEILFQFHPSVTNWLPFFWKGYEQQTRYTYVLRELDDLDAVFEGLKATRRSQVRKARKHFEIVPSDDISPLHQLKLKEYERKGLQLPYSTDYFQNMDGFLGSQGSRKLFYAIDQEGVTNAGIYLVLDNEYCHYLISSMDPDTKGKDAMSLLVWEGILYAAEQDLSFDFEGSMIEPIEQFFRSFGAEQMPYHSVGRTPSPLLRMKKALSYSVSGA